ncbi:MAG: hybrid sensor histidine kinase/response regulator [Cyanobacteria bacterium P01_C01_bin.89]
MFTQQSIRVKEESQGEVTHRSRIVAVDDVADNLFLLEAVLHDIDDYELTCFEDSQEALQHVQSCPPDLLLLDVMMPELDGYEFTQRVRADNSLPYIPILLLTAHHESSPIKGLDHGADEFIRKPIAVDELSARVRALLRLKKSVDEQVAMAQQREDFVARLTHDLRTPLVAANRVLEMAVNDGFGETPEPLRDILKSVISNNSNLLAMANTLLEVYRYDAGKKEMAFARINVHRLATDVVAELAPLATGRSLELRMDADPSLAMSDCWVMGDGLEMRQVITNLVGNALKFTDEGEVVVQLFLPEADQVAIAIRDTGVGIPQGEKQEIFNRFRQGQHMRAGSGLGLHLSQRVVEAHGGRITVDSTVGQGSCFTVWLPRAAL